MVIIVFECKPVSTRCWGLQKDMAEKESFNVSILTICNKQHDLPAFHSDSISALTSSDSKFCKLDSREKSYSHRI